MTDCSYVNSVKLQTPQAINMSKKDKRNFLLFDGNRSSTSSDKRILAVINGNDNQHLLSLKHRIGHTLVTSSGLSWHRLLCHSLVRSVFMAATMPILYNHFIFSANGLWPLFLCNSS
jgi:hypothetical protein